MTVLVLGGSGFIGARVVRRLAEAGKNPVCLDGNPDLFRLEDLRDRFRFIKGDITYIEDIIAAIKEHDVDQVINMAYMLGDAGPQETVRIDILGMNNAFEAARLTGVERVLYASSIARHGPQEAFGDGTVREDDPGHPTTLYGWAKQFNEAVAGEYARRYGMTMVAVRPAYVFGAAPRRWGPIGASHMISDVAVGNPSVVAADPDQRHLLVHVDDVAEIFLKLSQAPTVRYPAFLTGGHVTTFRALADIVRTFVPQAEISFSQDRRRSYDLVHNVDAGRVWTELGIEQPPLEQRVLDTINAARRMAGQPPVG